MKYTVERFEGTTDTPFRVVDTDTGEYAAMCFSEADASKVVWALNNSSTFVDIHTFEDQIESLRVCIRSFCENRSEEHYRGAVWSLRDIYSTLRRLARHLQHPS